MVKDIKEKEEQQAKSHSMSIGSGMNNHSMILGSVEKRDLRFTSNDKAQVRNRSQAPYLQQTPPTVGQTSQSFTQRPPMHTLETSNPSDMLPPKKGVIRPKGSSALQSHRSGMDDSVPDQTMSAAPVNNTTIEHV